MTTSRTSTIRQYVVEKHFEFDYSHRLHLQPAGHKCGSLHGHSGVVSVSLKSADTDYRGFVVEFGDLNFFKTWIDTNWDHAVLVSANDPQLLDCCLMLNSKHWVLPAEYCQTSSELLSEYLYELFRFKCPLVTPYELRVGLSETRNNFAYYGDF